MKPPNFSLAGKVALVTGSSTGLGKAMAFALGRAGAKVALNYANNEARAAETLEQFRAEEIEHRDTAVEHGAEDAPAHALLTSAIKSGSRLAIWLSERI